MNWQQENLAVVLRNATEHQENFNTLPQYAGQRQTLNSALGNIGVLAPGVSVGVRSQPDQAGELQFFARWAQPEV